MDKETRLEILNHGLRWATNIMVEVMSDHNVVLSKATKEKLTEASIALHKAMYAVSAEASIERRKKYS